MAYSIKQIPQDFIVEETMDLKMEDGPYSYFLLEKTGRNTQDMMCFLAEKLYVDEKSINYAGTKDKNAVSRQYISVFNCKPRKDFTFKDASIKYLGQGKERINLGYNKGNKFIITIRNLDKKDVREKEDLSLNSIINYFDEQRFSQNNVEVGLLMLKRKFKQACELIEDKYVSEYLEGHKGDYIGALRAMPKKTLSLYFNSVQSKIWNDCAAKLVIEADKSARKVKYSDGIFAFPKKELKSVSIPLLGFGTELTGKVGKIIEKSMEENNLSKRDFIVKEIPGSSSEGANRELIAEVKYFRYEYADDELNKGKTKCTLQFELNKGSYATIVVKTIFG